MRYHGLTLMLAVLSVLLSVVIHAEVPNAPRPGRTEVRASATFFKTSSNYVSGGIEELPGGGSLTNVQGEALYVYDWQADWKLFGGFNLGWTESSDGTYTRTNSGLNEVIAGGQNWYEIGQFDFAAEGVLFYPLWRPDADSDEALIGEGAMRLRAGGWLILPRRGLRPFAYGGFEYRDGPRAYVMPYRVGAKYSLRGWWVQGEYRGFEAVSDDADVDDPSLRNQYLKDVNGGSFHFYSINPSGSEVAFEVGKRFGALTVMGGAAMTVNGKNTSDGFSVTFGLMYSPQDTVVRVDEDDFNIRRERYDESLFRNERPSDAGQFEQPQFREDPNFVEPPPVVAPPKPKPRPVRPARPAKPAKQQAIEEAQEVEMQLELRPTKKKVKKKKPAKNLDKLMQETERSLEQGL